MLYIVSFLDDVSLVKLQSCYVLFVRGNSYRKISAEDSRARNLLLCMLWWYIDDISDRIKFLCNLLVRALKNVGITPLRFKLDMPRAATTTPTLILEWRWKICWLVPSCVEFAFAAFTPRLILFASARDTFLFRRISLHSDFASKLLARAESCRRAHINANVIHRRGIRPDSKKFYKFWVGCNPSHGIARGSLICEDWSAATFRNSSIRFN